MTECLASGSRVSRRASAAVSPAKSGGGVLQQQLDPVRARVDVEADRSGERPSPSHGRCHRPDGHHPANVVSADELDWRRGFGRRREVQSSSEQRSADGGVVVGGRALTVDERTSPLPGDDGSRAVRGGREPRCRGSTNSCTQTGSSVRFPDVAGSDRGLRLGARISPWSTANQASGSDRPAVARRCRSR